MDIHTSTAFVKAEKKGYEDNNLPKSYGKTEAFLLPKDPGWMFLFWEITPSTYDYVKQNNGHDIFERARAVIRLHDVTDVNFDGSNSRAHWISPSCSARTAGICRSREAAIITSRNSALLRRRANLFKSQKATLRLPRRAK